MIRTRHSMARDLEDLNARLKSARGLNRRDLLKLGGIGFAALAATYVTGCGDDDDSEPEAESGSGIELADSLRISMVSDSGIEAFMSSLGDPFTEEYGVEWRTETYGINEQMVANLRAAASDYDIVDISDFAIYPAVSQELLEPLRLDSIPNYENLEERWQSPKTVPSSDKYVVMNRPGMYIFVHMEDEVPEVPDSYEPLFDPQYSQRISARDYGLYRMLQTACYLGMDPNDMDVDRVFEALREQRELVRTYWTNAAELRGLLANREVWIADFWMNEAVNLKEELPAMKYWFPQEGGPLWAGGACIAKGSKNRDTAEFFLNWMLEPENMMRYAVASGNVPTIKAELFDVDSYRDDNPDMATYWDAMNETGVELDIGYMMEHQGEWNERYEEMKMGG